MLRFVRFIMSESLQRILKRDKPKAEIVENMTRSFFKQSDSEEAVITIKPNKMTRSQAQNRLYWMKMVYDDDAQKESSS